MASTAVKQVQTSTNAVREKAKSIVDLLTNEELLEEERVKAKTIRERLAGASS
jgi:multidrug resistance efflux pump